MTLKKLFIYSIARFYYKNFLSFKVLKQKFLYRSNLDIKYKPFLEELKLKGCVKIPDFFTQEEIIKFRQNVVPDLDALDEKHIKEESNEIIYYENHNKMIKKKYGYSRIFNLHLNYPELGSFLNNQKIKDLASAYYGRECFPFHNNAQKSLSIEDIGLDWHIDDFLPRFKALVYLYDVEIDDGPFSILKYSHKVFWKKLFKIHKMHTKSYSDDSIFSKEEISELNFEKIICAGKAGDLFLVDVCGIHRGLPIKKNHTRYVLFNYYSPDRTGLKE